MAKRAFRSAESISAESESRALIAPFLKSRGFREIEDIRVAHGSALSQTVTALTKGGERVAIRVRLCWRRRDKHKTPAVYSATQLRARVRDGDWTGTLQSMVENLRADGVTHVLAAQPDHGKIVLAALIPLDELLPVWLDQRTASSRALKAGDLGRRTKNHAMNGSSPTLWLRDDSAPEVTNVLWTHAGVQNLTRPGLIESVDYDRTEINDSLQDLPGVDTSALGRDGAPPQYRMRSYVPRDPRVRSAVRLRAEGTCERASCGETRGFEGFLDVHHILGVEKSDRVHNCVAICPNCHRDAHVSPRAEEINAELLRTARRKSKLYTGSLTAASFPGARLRTTIKRRRPRG